MVQEPDMWCQHAASVVSARRRPGQSDYGDPASGVVLR
jgi:hypothetical protein